MMGSYDLEVKALTGALDKDAGYVCLSTDLCRCRQTMEGKWVSVLVRVLSSCVCLCMALVSLSLSVFVSPLSVCVCFCIIFVSVCVIVSFFRPCMVFVSIFLASVSIIYLCVRISIL